MKRVLVFLSCEVVISALVILTFTTSPVFAESIQLACSVSDGGYMKYKIDYDRNTVSGPYEGQEFNVQATINEQTISFDVRLSSDPINHMPTTIDRITGNLQMFLCSVGMGCSSPLSGLCHKGEKQF